MSAFREHYIGSLVAYTAYFCVSLIASLLLHLAVQFPVDWNPTLPLGLWKIPACFGIAVLSGLWPDVDTKSKSQKICYQVFIVFNIVLLVRQRYHESAFLGLFAMLPLIGKHRGWTHSKLTMLLLPTVFLILPIYFQGQPLNSDQLLSASNLELITNGLPFYTASVVGYATHLHLDGILLQSRKTQRRKARANSR